jgi:hypothetical protein
MAIYDFLPRIPSGFAIAEIKQWRTDRHNAGKPSGFDDFLAAHGFCAYCRAAGRFITRISWRDSKGDEKFFESPIADPPVELASVPKGPWEPTSEWQYEYTPCSVCGGTG